MRLSICRPFLVLIASALTLGTALYVLRTIAESGRELGDLASDLTTFPQVLVNVKIRKGFDFDADDQILTIGRNEP